LSLRYGDRRDKCGAGEAREERTRRARGQDHGCGSGAMVAAGSAGASTVPVP
jgi:hypothetical protein